MRASQRVHTDIKARLDRLDWPAIERDLWDFGYAKTPPLLTAPECAELIQLYDDETRFRRRIDMARHRYGVGDYKYFTTPLPPLVEALRQHAYPPLAAIANRWLEALRIPACHPADLATFLAHCQQHGQTKPTPLLLHYEAGGYNCLHQDLYGEVAFPLQLTCFLSQPGHDYSGGAFLLVEQRPRAQSRGEAIIPARGEMIIFTTRYRPVLGKRGYSRVIMRHGVSRILTGTRYTLGVIFHDAQ